MTPERVAALVLRWARVYTRGLPAAVAERRVDELAADLHDQIEHERAAGTGERRIALALSSRLARGVAADAAWRRRARRRAGGPSRPFARSLVRVALVVAVILSLPLAATLFTDGAGWSGSDFLVAAILLGGTGVAVELLVRKARDNVYRAAVALALGTTLGLVWINLAVGMIGEPGEPANALYLGVLAVGLASTIVARLRPEAMVRALLATAAAQAAVAVIALLAGTADVPGSSVAEIVLLNGLFVALFVASACLFRLAARQRPPASVRA